ncbi:dephospho-CoA kinase [Porticoccus sp.]|nr:MAG: dephospho-CoA kinase [Gammaproteobacteria bacterium]
MSDKKFHVFTVGLTGGIGSGKSAVANQFRALGIDVIDADQAARQAVEVGSDTLKAIADHFGEEALLKDGSLNRAYLRKLVFDHPQHRQWLESLLHPIIRDLIDQALQRVNGPYAILESPLLLETDQHLRVDRVLVVDVPEAVQIQRARVRDGSSESQILAIMKSQLTREQRLSRADDILDNSGPPGDLTDAVAQLHKQYLKLAGEQR